MIDAQSCHSKMTCAYLYIGAKVDTVILRGSLSSCIAMPLQFVHSEVHQGTFAAFQAHKSTKVPKPFPLQAFCLP